MATISLCMIVKNEEDVLSRCLESAAPLVDEIIIVDTGSDDQTVAIAKAFTSKVYTFPWIDDFAAARNFSFSKAEKDYCMWLDADDVIEAPQQKKFLELKASLKPEVDVVMMKYNTAFDANGLPTFSFYRERLIRNNGKYLWSGQVHEAITATGVVIHSDTAISHKKLNTKDPDRNINIYRKMIANGQSLEPRHQYYYARELYYHGRYQEAVDYILGFLDDQGGWIENKIEACSIASYCYEQLGKKDEELQILFRSFSYDSPRAEICCDIGKYFLKQENYQISAYWYQRALDPDRQVRSSGFIRPDCYNYLPYIQLCVCYDKLGDKKRAEAYNEKAGSYKPESKAYLQNKKYFAKLNKN